VLIEYNVSCCCDGESVDFLHRIGVYDGMEGIGKLCMEKEREENRRP